MSLDQVETRTKKNVRRKFIPMGTIGSMPSK